MRSEAGSGRSGAIGRESPGPELPGPGRASGGRGPSDREILLTALGAMKLAGLALYGSWPDTGRELATKADVYAGAVRRRAGSLAFVVEATERWIDRGERFPSAKEFADVCAEIRGVRTMLVGRDVRDAEGRIVTATVEVRRGASASEIAAAFAAAFAAREVSAGLESGEAGR